MAGLQQGANDEAGTRKDSDKITQAGYAVYDAIKKRKQELSDWWNKPEATPKPK